MGVPKFLPREEKGKFNMRINKKLLDDVTKYAVLSETTITDIVTRLIKDFMKDKTVSNDYLDYGVTINIPTSEEGKKYYSEKILNLKGLKEKNRVVINYSHETIPVETIEIKRIPNNLDEFDGTTFKSTDEELVHEGIEFYVYNESVDRKRIDFVEDEYLNNLYCFYFEVKEDRKVSIYLIDYLDAINYLDGKDDITKDNLVACVRGLKTISKTLYTAYEEYNIAQEKLDNEFEERLEEEIDLGTEGKYFEEKGLKEQNLLGEIYEVMEKQDNHLQRIADKYNTGNVVVFGTDVKERIIFNNINSEEEIDKKIDELKNLIITTEHNNEIFESMQNRINRIADFLEMAQETIESNEDLEKELEKEFKLDT